MFPISVIIPALNEAKHIARLVHWLRQTAPAAGTEIIVVDGGSRDDTVVLAKESGATVLQSLRKGRAVQMNMGAHAAKGSVMYFVHADVLPPETWAPDIRDAIEAGIQAGCFSFRFDSPKRLLRINARLTRRDSIGAGGGDQTLFVTRRVFEDMGGFDERLAIMEDFDFVWRLKRVMPFHIIPHDAVVSARKYEKNSYLRVQVVNFITLALFRFGYSDKRLAAMYKRLLKP